MENPLILVSACLAGVACRYDGSAKPCPEVLELVRQGRALPVCPEQLGGLPTPRPPFEINNGRVVSADGEDVTEAFRRGAAEVLALARLAGCREAVLQPRSPSCGCGRVYDGGFSGRLVPGNGILVELLLAEGIAVREAREESCPTAVGGERFRRPGGRPAAP